MATLELVRIRSVKANAWKKGEELFFRWKDKQNERIDWNWFLTVIWKEKLYKQPGERRHLPGNEKLQYHSIRSLAIVILLTRSHGIQLTWTQQHNVGPFIWTIVTCHSSVVQPDGMEKKYPNRITLLRWESEVSAQHSQFQKQFVCFHHLVIVNRYKLFRQQWDKLFRLLFTLLPVSGYGECVCEGMQLLRSTRFSMPRSRLVAGEN